MIDLNDIAIFAKVAQLEASAVRRGASAYPVTPCSVSRSISKRGTVLTMAALVPSVKFNGTITPREVREQG